VVGGRWKRGRGILRETHHSVALSVLEEAEDELDGLDGPATPGGAEGGGLASAAGSTGEPAEGNALLLLLDISEVGVRLLEVHAGEGGGDLVRVLEVNTEVGAPGVDRLGGDLHGLAVPDHLLSFEKRKEIKLIK